MNFCKPTIAQFKKKPVRRELIDPKLFFGEHNILFINDKIIEKLDNRAKFLNNYKEELERYIEISKNSNEPVDRALAKHKISKLREKIKSIETGLEVILYKSITEKIINEYKSLCCSEIKSFLNSQCIHSNKKERLIISFLSIAQEYIDIEGFVQKKENVICVICGTEMEHLDSSYICGRCGREVEILDDTPSFKDISRVTTAAKYEHVKNTHFIKALKEFQGIHSVNKYNLKKAVEILLKQMEMSGLTKENVTKDHLYSFLEDLKMNSHYANIHILYALITGKSCIDLSDWTSEIMSLFSQQEMAYESVSEGNRDNSLIVNYKLLKILQRLTFVHNLPYSFKKYDFFCLKTNDKKCEHDEVMEKAWKYLGWEWISST